MKLMWFKLAWGALDRLCLLRGDVGSIGARGVHNHLQERFTDSVCHARFPGYITHYVGMPHGIENSI